MAATGGGGTVICCGGKVVAEPLLECANPISARARLGAPNSTKHPSASNPPRLSENLPARRAKPNQATAITASEVPSGPSSSCSAQCAAATESGGAVFGAEAWSRAE